MKTLISISSLLALSVLLTGCGESHADQTAATPGAVYKEGRGLQLTSGASDFAGLKTEEVIQRQVGAAKDVLAVPAAALLRTIKGDFVYVANGDWLLRTPVSTGVSDGGWVEITDGLYEGDRVVTHGTRCLWLAEVQAVNGGVGCADGH